MATTVPALPARDFGRWAWRQLTSMRTALLLLLLLAIAAVPGSVVPQQGVDAANVAAFKQEHPTLGEVFDTVGMFSVFSSVWFSAVYLLLMVSLVGCILPRSFGYVRALRARPPRTPRNLLRLPGARSFQSDLPPEEIADRAFDALRRRRFRIDRDTDGSDVSVRAERGYLREAGNLVFHLAVVVVLVGVVLTSSLGYGGSVIVVEGTSFANTLTQYDDFRAGTWFDPQDMPPFALDLASMEADFAEEGPQRGAPTRFEAAGTYTAEPGAEPRPFDIEVNHPLEVNGTSVFLIGQGYAPHVTVRDGSGAVVFSEAVPFLPADGTYTSNGVVKVPDAQPEQLGFEGLFLPTAVDGADGVAVSIFPDALNPYLGLTVFRGDLGLDEGTPQSVYVLDDDRMTQLEKANGDPLRLELSPGETARLPEGLGSITFDGVQRFARFEIGSSPWAWLPLTGVALGLLGLMASLYIRPRRAWVRARRVEGRTVVEVAGLDRVSGGDLASDLDELCDQLGDTTRESDR